ncbi:hypothetical protein SAMN05421835_108186 [Amycolatopsis sacchari]|uniref:Uncharacterized protein n=1 Tax=Amycolatopsis sacchari TaxID=115433 RepID=A0A1I3TZG0_9PSEU|nr:hypothetical protein [Amycolatopsis sacchari]SFJ76664.1 hypothetical protein SAMN05421835_108186 [Amycolatopsis sacchari]
MSKAHKHALTQLRQAEQAVGEWIDVIRETAEARTGSTAPEVLITDALYGQALELFDALWDAVQAFSAQAWLIDRQAGVRP